jgi:hypothetical protein
LAHTSHKTMRYGCKHTLFPARTTPRRSRLYANVLPCCFRLASPLVYAPSWSRVLFFAVSDSHHPWSTHRRGPAFFLAVSDSHHPWSTHRRGPACTPTFFLPSSANVLPRFFYRCISRRLVSLPNRPFFHLATFTVVLSLYLMHMLYSALRCRAYRSLRKRPMRVS